MMSLKTFIFSLSNSKRSWSPCRGVPAVTIHKREPAVIAKSICKKMQNEFDYFFINTSVYSICKWLSKGFCQTTLILSIYSSFSINDYIWGL